MSLVGTAESRAREASSPNLTHHAPPWRTAEWNLKDGQLSPNWTKPLKQNKTKKPVRLIDIENRLVLDSGEGAYGREGLGGGD